MCNTSRPTKYGMDGQHLQIYIQRSRRPTDDDKISKHMATLLCEIFILPLRFKSRGVKVKVSKYNHNLKTGFFIFI